MKSKIIVSMGLSIVLIGCSSPRPTVVLDSWWDVDYAKQSCNGQNPCQSDPIQAVHEFETELTTQFAAQAACANVQFIRFNGPNEASKTAIDTTQKPYWSLSLNFIPGIAKQKWHMVKSSDRAAILQGKGTPTEIAKEVCVIVNGQGAKVLN